MPNKTIYVKDEDLALYDKVQAAGGGSISTKFAEFLKFEDSLQKPQSIQQPIHFFPMQEMSTLRDQFAMAALPGIMFAVWKEWPKDWAAYPEEAYKMADAMMEARKK